MSGVQSHEYSAPRPLDHRETSQTICQDLNIELSVTLSSSGSYVTLRQLLASLGDTYICGSLEQVHVSQQVPTPQDPDSQTCTRGSELITINVRYAQGLQHFIHAPPCMYH